MRQNLPESYAKNPRRAVFKLLCVAAGGAVVFALLALLLNNPALNRLKFNLSLSSLVIAVLAINLILAAGLGLLYAAYQWVRNDLKPPRSEDVADRED